MTGVAALGMYDLAGLEQETDALWAALRSALADHGIEAPAALTRDQAGDAVWRDPHLVLAQTCGLPLVTGRAGDATVLGAFDAGLEGCPPGYYNSVIVVHADDQATTGPGDLTDASFAFNEIGSQSGYAALKRFMGPQLGAGVETGSHLASLAAVARRQVTLAALDAMTWRLAQQVSASHAEVRVLGLTPPTPGLPLITAPGRDAAPYRAALADALNSGQFAEGPLGIRGFVAFDRADYDVAIWPVV